MLPRSKFSMCSKTTTSEAISLFSDAWRWCVESGMGGHRRQRPSPDQAPLPEHFARGRGATWYLASPPSARSAPYPGVHDPLRPGLRHAPRSLLGADLSSAGSRRDSWRASSTSAACTRAAGCREETGTRVRAAFPRHTRRDSQGGSCSSPRVGCRRSTPSQATGERRTEADRRRMPGARCPGFVTSGAGEEVEPRSYCARTRDTRVEFRPRARRRLPARDTTGSARERGRARDTRPQSDARVLQRDLLIAVIATALACATSSTQAAGERSSSPPPLTRDVPHFVKQVCATGRSDSPIRLVCPPLVPVTKYRRFQGVNGVLLGNQFVVPQRAKAFYLLGFNAGDTGPTYWHWMAGMGTREAIQWWVLFGRPQRGEGEAETGRDSGR